MGLEPAPDFRDRRSVYAFGVFELDLRERELRKHGLRIKLQEQPLGILILLLEEAGQIVSRERIRARLWPTDTYVDYENAINSAMRKLRDALGDMAENPRFVETVPRRGYRFVAPVSNRIAAAEIATPRLEVPSDTAPSETATQPGRGRRRWLLVAVVFTLAASFGAAGWFMLDRRPINTQLTPPVEET